MEKKIHKREKGVGRERASAGEQRDFFFFFPSLRFFFRSIKIGPHVFVGTEGKVDPRNEGYAWTPKYWSFVKLHEVGNFPTCDISSLKAM